MISVPKVIALALSGLLAATFVFGSWFTTEQGQRTIVLRAGKLSYVAEPGFNFKLPIIDSTYDMEVRTRKVTYKGVASYSRDIQQSTSVVAVNYELPAGNVGAVFSQYGREFEARVVQPAILDKFKEVMGRYTAAEVIAERERFGQEVFTVLALEVKPYGVLVTNVQIENIDFSDVFEKAIEAAMIAKTKVSAAEQVLLQRTVEAKTVVVQATANAEAARQKAAGEADAIRLTSKAQADAIRLRGEALAANPRLPELTAAERWNGALPTQMIPGSSVPFLNVK